MVRLEKEIESKKNQLKLLYDEVKKMENKIVQRNPSNKALPTVSFCIDENKASILLEHLP